ncbi:hypothetical protein EYV94_03340 [Puteibacter caeruleilacunae]|nr:hypothetical protein EYV94_03340 [Puteibacter caeruleilacunae]
MIKNYIIILLAMVTLLPTGSKADELTDIAKKYRTWIIGDNNIEYNNPVIQQRYQAILEYVDSADKKYDGFTFTPKKTFDFSTKPNQKEARFIFSELLFPLSLGYHLPGDSKNKNKYYQNPNTKKKILKLFNYLRTKGWKEGIDMCYKNMDTYRSTGVVGFGGSMGNNFLGYSISLFLNKELLSQENMLDNELKTLNWISNVVGPQFSFPKLWEVTGYNADGVRAMLNNRMCYVLSLPANHPKRTDEAKYFSKLFDKSLQIADGWADLIKSDYMGYHHKNAYLSAYAPNAYHTASLMTYLLNGSSYQVSDKAIDNLSKAILTTRIYTNKYDCPRASAGRFPENLGVLVRNMPCFAYMAQVDATNKQELEGAFARLWDPGYEHFKDNYIESVGCKIMYHGSIGALQVAVDQVKKNIRAEDDPHGSWFYPYAGLGIYRQDNWLLSFKGNSKYIWDYESSKTENFYGRFVSAGALRIMAGGNPVSAEKSGYTIDGWNWTRLPGATTLEMPYEKLRSKKTRNFTPESYLGGVNMGDNCGVVSMKYNAPLNNLSLNKSFFFFDDYVVAIGSNIAAKDEPYMVQTTLFQNGLQKGQKRFNVNGQDIQKSVEKKVDAKDLFLTDAQGHAYFVKGNNTITYSLGKQTAPLHHGKQNATADFASARILHGENPGNESYLYMIQINGGVEGAKHLAKDHDYLFQIIQQDEVAHIVNYKACNTTAYALLSANKTSNDALISKTNTPCLAMVKSTTDNKVELKIQNPELGKIDKKIGYNDVNNYWHKSSTVQPVTLTLKGSWKLDTPNKEVKVIEMNKTQTTIQFECFDAKVIAIGLSRQ